MRTTGSPAELERRRLLAVQRVLEGYATEEVADFLGVDPSSVRRWLSAFRADGWQGLDARPPSGRPPKLTHTQAKIVLRWLADSPTEHGFATDLWTCPRVAIVIQEHFGVTYHSAHVWRLLRQLGWSCQKPEQRARERDEAEIQRWRREEWPRIKKGRAS